MEVCFWGVRGSIPTPLTPKQIKSKISSIISRVQIKDLENEKSRETFLARLPESLFSTTGGNTSCVEVKTESSQKLIFDAGTGIREFAKNETVLKPVNPIYHIFLSHYHWDHIQGLPFFSPAFNKNAEIHFYSTVENFEVILKNQMKSPYFPITMDLMSAKLFFHYLSGESVFIDNTIIQYRKMNHPGESWSYRIEENNKKIIYSTDTELTSTDFDNTEENFSYFHGADILIIDAQYTLGEAIEKYNWGHSSFSTAVDFAMHWKIKKLVLFHHEPLYSDTKLAKMYQAATWYVEHIENCTVEVFLATEGGTISI